MRQIKAETPQKAVVKPLVPKGKLPGSGTVRSAAERRCNSAIDLSRNNSSNRALNVNGSTRGALATRPLLSADEVRQRMSKPPDIPTLRGGAINANRMTPEYIQTFWSQIKKDAEDFRERHSQNIERGAINSRSTNCAHTQSALGKNTQRRVFSASSRIGSTTPISKPTVIKASVATRRTNSTPSRIAAPAHRDLTRNVPYCSKKYDIGEQLRQQEQSRLNNTFQTPVNKVTNTTTGSVPSRTSTPTGTHRSTRGMGTAPIGSAPRSASERRLQREKEVRDTPSAVNCSSRTLSRTNTTTTVNSNSSKKVQVSEIHRPPSVNIAIKSTNSRPLKKSDHKSKELSSKAVSKSSVYQNGSNCIKRLPKHEDENWLMNAS